MLVVENLQYVFIFLFTSYLFWLISFDMLLLLVCLLVIWIVTSLDSMWVALIVKQIFSFLNDRWNTCANILFSLHIWPL